MLYKKYEHNRPDGGTVINAQNAILERPRPSHRKSDLLEICHTYPAKFALQKSNTP